MDDCLGNKEATGARGGERDAEEAAGGSRTREVSPQGSTGPKTVGLRAKRQAEDAFQKEHGLGTTHFC